jgi:hypothetical protein
VFQRRDKERAEGEERTMSTAAGRTVIAIVLYAAAAACWAEARAARRVAEAHERLATLHYDSADALDRTVAPLDRLPWPLNTLRDEVSRHRARVGYWRAREIGPVDNGDSAPPAVPGAAGANRPDEQRGADPEVLFVAANTAFRAVGQTTNRAVVVERLDNIIQAYADVLRAAPGNSDAAYNYEFVVKHRDEVAKGRGPLAPKPESAAAGVDLPAGSTIHGQPGGPPDRGGQFKTIAPMSPEERDEAEALQGEKPRRRG